MTVDRERYVVHPKVGCSRYLKSHQLKSLLECSPGVIHVGINFFNIEHHKFWKPLSTKDFLESIFPISYCIHFKSLKSVHIDNMYKLAYLVNKYHWADTTEVLGKLLWENDHVITADWCELHHDGVFIVHCTVLLIVRYLLLWVSNSARDTLLQEGCERASIWTSTKLKVKASISLWNIQAFLILLISQYELFHKQKGPLVLHPLPNLHNSFPEMRRVSLFAIVALKIYHLKLDDLLLLQNGSVHDLLLES